MEPRDRVLQALQHKETDQIPFSWGFGVNEPAKVDLMKYLGMETMEELDEYLLSVDDVRWVWPAYVGPQGRCCYDDEGVRTDEFGVKWKYIGVKEGGGYEEQYENPLKDAESPEDVKDYLFPDPSWWDMSVLPEQIRKINAEKRYAIKIGNGNPFERVSWMLGFENTLISLMINPELIHHLMDRATNYFIGFFDAAIEAAGGMIDLVFTADDLAGQEGLLMSPEQIEEFIAPYHKRLNDFLHGKGIKILYHSCGAVMEAVPQLIGCGVDVLESLQFYTRGMEPELLKDRFGADMCFHGGVSVQKTLVTGTPEDVRQEVAMLKKVLGRQGGYILAPAHHVQAGTPPENLLAMLEEAGRPIPEKKG